MIDNINVLGYRDSFGLPWQQGLTPKYGIGRDYEPLYLDLRNFMLVLNQVDIFPPRQYGWEFTDEPSLLKQLVSVEQMLINNAIRWLEDPTTTNPLGRGGQGQHRADLEM